MKKLKKTSINVENTLEMYACSCSCSCQCWFSISGSFDDAYDSSSEHSN